MTKTSDTHHSKLLITFALLLLITLFFVACANKNLATNCQELDWYEIGRQDGAKGLINNSHRTVTTQCAESDLSLSEALYHNGFDAGSANSCTYTNGFELGKKNIVVQNICPPLLKEEFQTGYSRGQRFVELQKMDIQIKNKIKEVNNKIEEQNSIALPKRGLLQGEKIELEEQAQKVARELEVLKNSINK